MTEAGNTKGKCQIRQRVFAFLSKVAALLGLAALGFLLTRPALPVGWVVIAVVVIQLSLAYSPRSAASRAAVPVRSTDCRRYRSQATSSYCCRRLGRTGD